MNILEQKILKTAKDLKDNFGAIAVKADFSAEALEEQDLIRMKEISAESGLDLYIKTGGCDAFNDICVAKRFNARRITAPMIETAYSMKKFVYNAVNVYSAEELKNTELFINIETTQAYKNFDEIIAIPEASYLSGIVMGRDDLCASAKIIREEINSGLILKAAKILMHKAKSCHKIFIIGGEIRPQAISFLKQLTPDKFETRKIVFDTQKAFSSDINEGILKALEFEMLLLEYKSKTSESIDVNIPERIRALNLYLKNNIKSDITVLKQA